MSTRRHKRRRIDQDTDSAHEDQLVLPSSPAYETEEVATTAADPEPCPEAPSGELDTETSAKEQEIWDAFKEEHYEVLEQLPLSLHRAFTLIQELDEQAQGNISNLTPAILKYVSLRRALAEVNKDPEGPPAGESVHNGETTQTPADAPEVEAGVESQTPHTNGNGKLSSGSIGSSLSPPPTSTPGPASTGSRTTPAPSRSLAAVIEDSDSTRELLIGIAQSAEEVSRASNEKYYLARHVYDLIDRYIRDLDRAINEQEASISLGLRPGTHPASIILPEVVVPKPARTRPSSPPPVDLPLESHVPPAPAPDTAPVPEPTVQLAEAFAPVKEATPPPSASPAEDEIIDITDDDEPAGPAAAEPVAPAPTATRGRRRGRKRRRFTRPPREPRTTSAAADENVPEKSMHPEEEEEEEEGPRTANQPPLTLKIPAQNLVPALPEGEVDPNEPRYCFCNQVSYGEMIACDNPTCEREWFHLGCVGLEIAPEGKWYCRDCAERVKRPRGKKRAR
ncbi:hypothetical protein C8T65DRAFT_739679 [Cerioporus squamosus]|nr:hypothetical protein C8T65DRAFT_739679 [Cerioporus squamosus]